MIIGLLLGQKCLPIKDNFQHNKSQNAFLLKRNLSKVLSVVCYKKRSGVAFAAL